VQILLTDCFLSVKIDLKQFKDEYTAVNEVYSPKGFSITLKIGIKSCLFIKLICWLICPHKIVCFTKRCKIYIAG